jgi:2-dehydro-3-deoxygalactonokinase
MLACGFGGETRSVPATPLPDRLPETGGVRIVPGLADTQFGSRSADGMVRIAGFLALRENWDGVSCVTGETHVWAHVSAGEVVSFQCFDTGRLARVLELGEDWRDGGFADAMGEVMSRPERFAAVLARANIDADRSAGWGVLIGAELAAARAFWLGQQVAVIGDDAGAEAMVAGLSEQAVPAERAGGLDCLIAGFDSARQLPEM